MILTAQTNPVSEVQGRYDHDREDHCCLRITQPEPGQTPLAFHNLYEVVVHPLKSPFEEVPFDGFAAIERNAFRMLSQVYQAESEVGLEALPDRRSG